ncbi:MAG: aldo/keto reductase [Bacteroidota bacterium]|nr:aldo/keto reductase [Bacteroidota bacterium]MDP4211201.1 aldo/keto reductase [Bacteroidota bacterium]MDP4248720.1 aldo/keto reductase [Bacteroidota bacterium]
MFENNASRKAFELPTVVFGTSALGNLYTALDDDIKLGIVAECIQHSSGKVVFDSAGKYGAGLALESLGRSLRSLLVDQENVMISNKLGWYRTELKTDEPSFEPGVWKDLKFDAVQRISYQGIRECFDQGNELLGGYIPQMLSVHDPDEYLVQARNEQDEEKRYLDILGAYQALAELKAQGRVMAIGVGAKDWKVIKRISNDVSLDWVMIANSMTIKSHPEDLSVFMKSLKSKGIPIINSAVFHSGFLIGSDYYDYRLIKPDNNENREIFQWRADFFKLCKAFDVTPAQACVQFALKAPGVKSIALNTSNPKRVKENMAMANAEVTDRFWKTMKSAGLIRADYLI